MLAIIHHDAFSAPLPPGHRFPMPKFSALARRIAAERLYGERGFVAPALAPAAWLGLVHGADYVDRVFSARVPADISRIIGLPVSAEVARRARAAVGGTVLAARLALAEGIACNTAGGSHHARAAHGAGFCVFNDVAVAIRVLQAAGEIGNALVVDLDVHQGDGTAAIFAGDATVRTVSLHGERNYPVRKVAGTVDVGFADGTGDAPYLAALIDVLGALDPGWPDIVFYNAGVDPHRDDRLGRLALSDRGLAERDKRVIGWARGNSLPVACVIGGGYSDDIEALADRHATLHRVAAGFV
ncbi:MAG: histone deacetylase [Flavobacteriaceae bacterium]